MNRELIAAAAAACITASRVGAQDGIQWTYVPELTGHYGVSSYRVWGTYLPGCNKDITISSTWIGVEGPRYMIYEFCGTVVEPEFQWSGKPNYDFLNPNEFNFNGGFAFPGGPNVYWGTSLNISEVATWGVGMHRLSSYDNTSGRFHFCLVLDTRALGYTNWDTQTLRVAARFMLYNPWDWPPDATEVTYLRSGSVHVESFRVGLSDLEYVIGSEALVTLSEYYSCDSDLDQDCLVDGADLGLLLSAWGSSMPAADINRDGTVDGADLGSLLATWGPCTN